jgi:hypothetical protein
MAQEERDRRNRSWGREHLLDQELHFRLERTTDADDLAGDVEN